EFARIFEQEYNNLVNEYTSLFQQEYNDYLHEHSAKEAHSVYYPKNYYEYLKRDDAKSVHQGYFSIDKKSKRAINSTVKRGKEDSDDESAYNLIMKNKERLLSFEEPVRFIFSHSALKEGWDNPNVFQICALKHSDAVIRRRQEVGRGMRLCVNKEGIRQDSETINEQVHKTNLLTVVASESYEDFAKGLQNEIKESIKDRPQKANTDYFIGKVVFDENNNEIKISKDIADKINKNLFKLDIINDDNKITDYGKQVIEENGLRLPEELSAFNIGVSKLLSNIVNGELPEFENANKKVAVKLNSNYHKKEFQDLWDKISYKSTYEVKFDTEKLIENSINRINANLSVSFLSYLVKKGVLEESTKEELEKGEGFKLTNSQREKIKGIEEVNVVYDLIGEIINHT
ncbi:MAG: restriction endonuclease subunit R, partial [Kiritimatiellia bacterium]|nr:restriction endonuclease subunit R [Kiritimatiellia bacterium]